MLSIKVYEMVVGRRQTDRQIHRQTNSQTDRQTGKRARGDTDIYTNR